MNNTNKKPEKKKSPAIIVITIALALFSLLDSAGGDAEMFIGFIVIVAVIVALIFAVIKIVNKAVYSGAGKTTVRSKAAQAVSKWSGDSNGIPAFSGSKPKSFAYDDRAYERNEQRDIQRRLSQLEDFLKNGIIEKEEYNILRARYERNGK